MQLQVQTGFGRTGDYFWGFESHDIVPDIVTMAKGMRSQVKNRFTEVFNDKHFLGIGNGFPLAAVVTTPEIAESLTQASIFNTFGGNPLASAVGISVLEVNMFHCPSRTVIHFIVVGN